MQYLRTEDCVFGVKHSQDFEGVRGTKNLFLGKIGDKFAIVLLWLNGARGFFDQVIVEDIFELTEVNFEVTTALPEVTLGKVDHWIFFLVLHGTFSSQEKSKLSVVISNTFFLDQKSKNHCSVCVFRSKSVSKLVFTN